MPGRACPSSAGGSFSKTYWLFPENINTNFKFRFHKDNERIIAM
uniref:Uncharacterized protein n=1 Tax=Anguilla anguilla TaxID=7936 RepID=A0A0E9SZT4_ANGAN